MPTSLRAVLLLSLVLTTCPLSAEEPKRPANHLAGETSPYLLAHAHNPVEWHPWGEAALELAKKENKPIFLSIGYSSCHWCHVMERESFSDEEIAKFLNAHFVCIKVDREERPDIDHVYMTAVQIMTRGGGWPLSVFLTPDGKPFYGGTYWPARDNDRNVPVGFLTVIRRVAQLWEEREADLRTSGDGLTNLVKQSLRPRVTLQPMAIDEKLLTTTDAAIAETFDPEHGGFNFSADDPNQPKFPEPATLQYLLARARSGSDEAKKMLTVTLDGIAAGGIRDHIGGGLHRYSVDRFWRIPHFEKMLYDNAQLASLYAEAYQLTGNPQYRRVAEETCDFVLSEMTGPEGQFYSAIDADSEGIEGKYYRWSQKELQDLLDAEELKLAKQVYGLGGTPNFEEAYFVPELQASIAKLPENLKLQPAELDTRLQALREKLLAKRSERVRPAVDTKALTEWNGLMIAGLADAGRILKRQDYVDAAARNADFLLANVKSPEGQLLRSYKDGQAKIRAYVNDYAMLIDGLIALHEATGEQKWLDAASRLMKEQTERFGDARLGGFYFTADDAEEVIARGKIPTDDAIPSGNSVSAGNLLYLADKLDDATLREQAIGAIRSGQTLLELAPAAAPRLLVAAEQVIRENNKTGE
ncbi:thioredoxin domain-containing protein [Blastopirellula sp. JC732]|uniref:Thioredoxin domain-containing protein n=1 Tax=Blastopirellula sediminis TaxID=2894196 RepID=A0A9X1SHG8_9BACT|nr:thioredoxin domain-containing protein [Blastopirellula sediminis]MCC9606314.1 thioredoxin domain-containing protein [Blastopirellula sediminis]MCC9630388.1 thioredoxin domain-containing protein [Blastopirellula sediminis]